MMLKERLHILVTSGAGFIGANLVRMLLDHGYQVTVLDNLSTGRREYLDGLSIEFIEGDILDADLVNRVVPGHDGIVHLAAQAGVPGSLADPRRDCEVNVIGTLNLLEACRRVVEGETSRQGDGETGRQGDEETGSRGAREQGSTGAEANSPLHPCTSAPLLRKHPSTSAPPHLRFIFASSNAPLGRQPPPATEDRAPLPISPHGASKLAGGGVLPISLGFVWYELSGRSTNSGGVSGCPRCLV